MGATYVLVHGAWHSGQVWDRVRPLLEAAGCRTVAPTLTGYGRTAPLMGPDVGLDTHVDDVVAAIEDADLHDVVLVGHSYAGMVVTSVLDRVPARIAALVYLDAMVPEDGETAVDVMPVCQVFLDHAAATDSPWRIPAPPRTDGGLFGVTDPDDIAWLEPMISAGSGLCLRQPARLRDPEAARVPRTHIHCVGGAEAGPPRRAVPPVQPDGTPADIRKLDTGHDAMVTVPAELAALLLDVRRRTATGGTAGAPEGRGSVR
ncbi:alpha/beta hydrolase [Pseudonocardia sp. ICBG1293]|uniref:alpha/beta hydrolase n=1 Tax=Pseudonocardia sp. ICBG1293 TaxID=2844382 RepID=UPI001CCB9D3B|nr:alpha/beta hydrolase [Pseudonocardia sp. ICBG1293]